MSAPLLIDFNERLIPDGMRKKLSHLKIHKLFPIGFDDKKYFYPDTDI